MEHRGTERLETDRLILRRFVAEDAPAVYRNWANDPEVTKYLMWPTHERVETTRSVVADWVAGYQNRDSYQWAMVLKEHGAEPIGSIGVVEQYERIAMFHIGYCIGRRWWNRGITSEALAAVVRYLFEEVGANRIESRHDPRNPGSGKVMQKCGLRCEGTHRQNDWNNQGVCDSVMYALLAEDYRAAR